MTGTRNRDQEGVHPPVLTTAGTYSPQGERQEVRERPRVRGRARRNWRAQRERPELTVSHAVPQFRDGVWMNEGVPSHDVRKPWSQMGSNW